MEEPSLEALLDNFRSEHSHMEVDSNIVDVTDAFREGGKYTGPRLFGEGASIYAYHATGARLAEKYAEEDGKLVRDEKDRLTFVAFDDRLKAFVNLCVKPVANMSYRAMEHALAVGGGGSIHGVNKRHLTGVKERLGEYGFDADGDSAFIFGGSDAYDAAQLNQIWLDQMVSYGSGMLEMMDGEEYALMEKLVSSKALEGDDEAIKEESYMYGRGLHVPQSIDFMQAKIDLYNEAKENPVLLDELEDPQIRQQYKYPAQ